MPMRLRRIPRHRLWKSLAKKVHPKSENHGAQSNNGGQLDQRRSGERGAEQCQHFYVHHCAKNQKGDDASRHKGAAEREDKEGVHAGADRDDEGEGHQGEHRPDGVGAKSDQNVAGYPHLNYSGNGAADD